MNLLPQNMRLYWSRRQKQGHTQRQTHSV